MEQSRAITRKSASNLALAFVLLPRPKRDGMSSLYAFCREVDDVADNESLSVEKRREQLAAWRADVGLACGTAAPRFPVNRELQTVIHRYQLPFEYFDELLPNAGEVICHCPSYPRVAFPLNRYCAWNIPRSFFKSQPTSRDGLGTITRLPAKPCPQ